MAEEKIICAVEHWDYILDYWKPNCWSSSWLLKEENRIGYPYNIFTGEVKHFHGSPNMKNIITPYFKNVEYKKYSEIENTSKYLYLIPVQPITFFSNKYGFKLISAEILNDVRSNRCNIVILFDNEGNLGVTGATGPDIKILDRWCDEVNIPYKNVYLIHGNLVIDELKVKTNLKINVVPASTFESWVYRESLKDFTTKYVGTSIFLNYNRQPRHQRLIFCCELIKNNLLEKGLVSFNTVNTLTYGGGVNIINTYDTSLIDTYENFHKQENLKLFLDTRTEDNLANSINTRHYDETFLSVVNEIFICEDMIFFSEKTWKPIFLGHPFILIGNPGSLKKLKELGYKTFDKWIDESYDENITLQSRYRIIINELKKFSCMDNEQLQTIRTEMEEICIHNKNNFLKQYNRKFSDNNHPIQTELKNIWHRLSNTQSLTTIARAPNDDFTFELFSELIKHVTVPLNTFYVWPPAFRNKKSIEEWFKEYFIFTENLILIGIKDQVIEDWYDMTTYKSPSVWDSFEQLFSEHPEKIFIIFTSTENLISINKNVHIINWGGDITNQKEDYQTLQPVISKNLNGNLTYVTLNNTSRMYRGFSLVVQHALDIEKCGNLRFNFTPPHTLENFNLKYSKNTSLYNILNYGVSKLKNLPPKSKEDIYQGNANDNVRNFKNSLIDYYKQSFVEIVNETTCYEPFMFTEKTLNSIYGCNFPIILCGKGAVSVLRDMGMDVFDDIIDHAYDEIPEPDLRIFEAISRNKKLLTDREFTKNLWLNNRIRFLNNVDFAKYHLYKFYVDRATRQWNELKYLYTMI